MEENITFLFIFSKKYIILRLLKENICMGAVELKSHIFLENRVAYRK